MAENDDKLFMEFLEALDNMTDLRDNDSKRLYAKTLQAKWRQVSREVTEPAFIEAESE